jgi:pyroglutamyl-peptidase
MKTILLTGFEPFGGEAINPSWEVARALDGAQIAGVRVHARQLPCAFGESLRVLDKAIEAVQPAIVLALGQASGRSELSLERLAINLVDARIPDNAGRQPVDVPVLADAPAAHFTTLPVKTMMAGLRAAGYPAGLSFSAGSFVCNEVFFGLQQRLLGRGLRSGFMHLPCLPEQAAERPAPSMALATQIAGVRLALELAVTAQAESHEVAGTIS